MSTTENSIILKGMPYDSVGFGAIDLNNGSMEIVPKVTFYERGYLGSSIPTGYKIIITDVVPMRVEQYNATLDTWTIIVSPYVEPIFSSGSSGGGAVSSFNTRTGDITLSKLDVTTALGGTPTTTKTFTLGNNLDTTFTITHNFGTKNIVSAIYKTATGEQVLTKLTHTTTQTTAVFLDPPTTNQYTLVLEASL